MDSNSLLSGNTLFIAKSAWNIQFVNSIIENFKFNGKIYIIIDGVEGDLEINPQVEILKKYKNNIKKYQPVTKEILKELISLTREKNISNIIITDIHWPINNAIYFRLKYPHIKYYIYSDGMTSFARKNLNTKILMYFRLFIKAIVWRVYSSTYYTPFFGELDGGDRANIYGNFIPEKFKCLMRNDSKKIIGIELKNKNYEYIPIENNVLIILTNFMSSKLDRESLKKWIETTIEKSVNLSGKIIYIKNHPLTTISFNDLKLAGEATVLDSKETFEAVLNRIKPDTIIGFDSTALILSALYCDKSIAVISLFDDYFNSRLYRGMPLLKLNEKLVENMKIAGVKTPNYDDTNQNEKSFI